MALIKVEGEVKELDLDGPSGFDMMCDVIGNCGVPRSADDSVDFEMEPADYEWWATWAHNEEVINAAIGERTDVPCFYDFGDWEEAQGMYAEFLGVEIKQF